MFKGTTVWKGDRYTFPGRTVKWFNCLAVVLGVRRFGLYFILRVLNVIG